MTSGAPPSGSSGSYEVTYNGHWEWWDYYSDGIYTGSSAKQFIIDSVSIVMSGGGLDPRNIQKY